jgi:hypothetical protein
MSDLEARLKKDRRHEIVHYSICGVFWLGGLAICILGAFAYNSPIKTDYNSIYQAQKNFGTWLKLGRMVDFRILGAIICLIAMCFFLGHVYHYANKYEKDEVRKAKQVARLNDLLEQDKANADQAIAAEKARQQAAIAASNETVGPAAPSGEEGPAAPKKEE